MQSIQDPPLVSCFCKQPSFQCGIKQRFADIEPRRVYRNCYRVFYRVPPTGPMTSEPAKLLLFYTGTNTATNGIMSLPGDWGRPQTLIRGNRLGAVLIGSLFSFLSAMLTTLLFASRLIFGMALP